jgi:altronate dehydratase
LSASDNVAVAVRPLAAGAADLGVTLRQDVPVGHKVALRAIEPGDKVIKWGVSIGSATRRIEPGEHVHTHNLKSDYLPTFTRDAGCQYGESTP